MVLVKIIRGSSTTEEDLSPLSDALPMILAEELSLDDPEGWKVSPNEVVISSEQAITLGKYGLAIQVWANECRERRKRLPDIIQAIIRRVEPFNKHRVKVGLRVTVGASAEAEL